MRGGERRPGTSGRVGAPLPAGPARSGVRAPPFRPAPVATMLADAFTGLKLRFAGAIFLRNHRLGAVFATGTAKNGVKRKRAGREFSGLSLWPNLRKMLWCNSLC